MKDKKTIHDPVHGGIVISGVFLKLLQRHEMQRLLYVKQLGLANVVFPGANHTRLEHSLGVFHLIGKMAYAMGLDEQEEDEVRAAALLHDIAHPAYSHTLEEIMEVAQGKGHMDMGRELIEGRIPNHLSIHDQYLDGLPSIGELLEESGISSRRVTDIITSPICALPFDQSNLLMDDSQTYFGNSRHMNQMIHGPVDADQMDYLLRDAHYTGVAHGAIDADRIMNTIQVRNGNMVVEKGGIVAVEGMMVARALMYTSIYYHKTVRIAEMMLTKALEASDEESRSDLHLKNDSDVLCSLMSKDGRAGEITNSILRRNLYKRALMLSTVETTDEERDSLLRITNYRQRKEAESEIANRAGVDISEVIIDLPSRSSLMATLRIGKTDIPILDGDRIRPISRYSPLAKALQSRDIHDWTVLVSCPQRHVEAVSKAAKRTLFS